MKRTISIILALAIIASLFSGLCLTANATLGQNEYNSNAERTHNNLEIAENQIVELAEGDDYLLTLSSDVTELTVVGNGAEFDDAGAMTSTPNEVIIDASAAPGVTITLENVYFSNNFNQMNTINFAGEGNTLIIRGTCVLDTDNNAYGFAAIHVGVGTELTLYGESGSKLYFYKREQGAGIGGNSREMNGNIIFGVENGVNDFEMYLKGTKQGALIGAGSAASSTADEPGSITFHSGVYNLVSNSRGAVIGGSAGGLASSGTDVYITGASLNLNIDYSGSAIGGGGYGGGNDSSGGNLYVTGGSVRTYIDANAAGATSGWMGNLWTQGINDAAITACRRNAEGQPVYWCIVTADGSVADLNEVLVDSELFYEGPAHNYCFIQETLDKGNQYDITSTPSNWLPNEDNSFYLYLTGESHTIQINDEPEVIYDFVPVYGEDETTVIGGSFIKRAADPTYSVAFSGVTADMCVEVFDAGGVTCGTGNNYFLKNGTYTYTVVSGSETVSTGSFTVNGAALAVPVTFHIVFDVTPQNASIELGGNEGQSGYVAKVPNQDGSYDLQAGSYQLTITADNYLPVSETIDISKSQILTYRLSEVHSYSADGFCTICGCYDPEAAAYTVRTPENLAAIAVAVNNADPMRTKTVTLASDLSLSAYPNWLPIGGDAAQYPLTLASQDDLNAAMEEHFLIYDSTGASYVRGSDKNGTYDANRSYYYVVGAAFDGVFDGAGYTISDLSVDTQTGYAGLFGNVTGTVKNLTVDGTVTSTTTADFVGGITGKLSAGGNIDHCTSRVNVTALSAYNIGGIAGFVGEMGQPVSDSNPMATVSNCVNYGDVSGYVRIGGIAGRNAGTIRLCANYGTIFNQSGQKKGTGGIVGMNGVNNAATDAGIVEFCYNQGYVNGNKGYWTGGIAGFQNAASQVKNCYNAGTLYTAATADGSKYSWVNPIVGQSEGAVENCYWLNQDTGDNTANYIGKDETGNGNAGGTVENLAGKTEEELKSCIMLPLLNTEATQAFIAHCAGFPVLSFEAATAHSYVPVVTPQTCTAGGYTTYTCSVCGDSYRDAPTDAAGHTEVIDAAVAPTCTESGLTQGKHCSVCNETLIAQQTVNALGHDWDSGVVTIAPTETATGVRSFTCARCGEEKTETLPMLEKMPFTDVPDGKWYTQAVKFTYANELFAGTSATTFSPEARMTRAMLVTVLWRLDGEATVEKASTFSDVPAGQFYTDAVSWAAENGIVNGVGGNRFNPDGSVTREEIAVILFRYAKHKGYDTDKTADLSKFPDSGKASRWAKEALSWANAEGLISGSSEGGRLYLLPAGYATRAQVAVILMRYVNNIVNAR